MENVCNAAKAYSSQKFWDTVNTKPKLCSFEVVATPENVNNVVKANLKRRPRNMQHSFNKLPSVQRVVTIH